MGEKPIKVLLIEDSVFAVRHTQKMLAEANGSQIDVQLECVDRLSTGLKRLAKGGIDVVLLDLTLPDSNDLDTFTSVHARMPEVPVVVLTGLGDEKLAVEAVHKGAQDYLVKGQLDSNLLKRSILYAIERKRTEEELRKHREHLEEMVQERTAQLKKTNEQLRKEITERERAKEKIAQQSDFLNHLLESLTHPFYVIDANDYTIKMANSATACPETLMNSITCYSLTHKFDKPCEGSEHLCPLREVKKTKKPVTAEHVHYNKFGEEQVFEVHGYPVFDKQGNVVQMIEYSLDITERKDAEKALQRTYEDLEIAHHQLAESQVQLIQTEKMSALGTLVAGTAHELNNPMMGILNFTSHCIKHTSEEDQLYTVLQDIEHEAKRCAEIVRNLLTFSHTEQDDDKAYQKESLTEILDRVLRLLSYRIEKQRISVTQHIADDTPAICIKPNSIQQLILNLATNAFDALQDSEKKEFNVDIHPDGRFVRMTISDTGCGISAGSLRSIFDPFFTTKPVGQGTGLGLSVSQGIVKAHGGQITCESEPGVGTKFTVLLPIENRERSKQNEQACTCN